MCFWLLLRPDLMDNLEPFISRNGTLVDLFAAFRTEQRDVIHPEHPQASQPKRSTILMVTIAWARAL